MTSRSMMLSGRQASRLLVDAGLTRRQSWRVLTAGLADLDVLYPDGLCPRGLSVARRDIAPTLDPEDQRRELGRDWRFSALTSAWLRHRISVDGRSPIVATVAGSSWPGPRSSRWCRTPTAPDRWL